MNETLHTQLDKAAWALVPDILRYTVSQSLPVAQCVRELAVDLPQLDASPYGCIWYDPHEKAAFVNFCSKKTAEARKEWFDALMSVAGLEHVSGRWGGDPVPPGFGKRAWVLIKRGATVADALHPVAQAAGLANSPLMAWQGGPNTLASTLTSGLLGAGLGYGIGRVGEALLPEQYFEKGKLRRTGAALGGLAGGAFPLWYGLNGGFGKHLPFQKGTVVNDPPQEYLPPPAEQAIPKAASWIKEMRKALSPWIDQHASIKLAEAIDSGVDVYVPRIPVNVFNNFIQQDPFLPPQYTAATTGLISAAGMMARSPYVSPADIARVGVGMGSGYVSGLMVGKALGALAGLRPEAQETLRRTGMMAGFLKNVVPIIFP